MRRAAAPVVLLLVAPAVGACGDDGASEVEGLPTVDGAEEIIVVGTDFAFTPSVLHLEAGTPVNVVLEVAEGGHDLAVRGVDFTLPIIDEGEVTRGALTIDEPGTYELVCLVPGHIDEGMVGTVEVT